METTKKVNGVVEATTNKTKKDISFEIPKTEISNWFRGDFWSTRNDIIEYSNPEVWIYPWIFKNGEWEAINEDIFFLSICYYADDVYTVSVLKSDWALPEDWCEEMYEHLDAIEEKWDIEFPTSRSFREERKNNIILNKAELLEFITDMKLDINDIFTDGWVSIPTDKESYVETGDGYRIKNILPTEFSDLGTFTIKKFNLEETKNGGKICIEAAIQSILGSKIENAWLQTVIDKIDIICMPDNIFKVIMRYKGNLSRLYTDDLLNEISSYIEIESWEQRYWSKYRLIEYIVKNTKQQSEISNKWNIFTPLSNALSLSGSYSNEIFLDKDELKDFIQDLNIPLPIVVPTNSTEEALSAVLVDQETLNKAERNKVMKAKKLEDERREECKQNAIGMMECILRWDISCDIVYAKDQKYILTWDIQNGVRIISYDMEYHNDIAKYAKVPKNEVYGWWRIQIDQKDRVVKLYGESTWFHGKIAKEYHDILVHVIKTKYPEYTIQIQ